MSQAYTFAASSASRKYFHEADKNFPPRIRRTGPAAEPTRVPSLPTHPLLAVSSAAMERLHMAGPLARRMLRIGKWWFVRWGEQWTSRSRRPAFLFPHRHAQPCPCNCVFDDGDHQRFSLPRPTLPPHMPGPVSNAAPRIPDLGFSDCLGQSFFLRTRYPARCPARSSRAGPKHVFIRERERTMEPY